MNTGFRVAVDFFTHHKARKLKKRLGAAAVLSLLQLWAYAAKLRGEGFDASEDGTGRGTPLVAALAIRGRDGGCNIEMRRDGLANTVCTQNGGRCGMGVGAVLYAAGVRRLLPVETERLMGFKDNYTRIPWKGKPAEECPDGPRYMTHGNSMPVPVMRWLARRTERVLLNFRARCAEPQEAMA